MKTFSLRLKLVVGLLLIGAIITIITSIIQVYRDYQDELDNIDDEFAIVARTALPALESAMWALDKSQVQLLLEGIVAMPKIQQVQILEGQRVYAESGQLPRGSAYKSQTYSIQYQGDQPHTLGELTVYASLRPVYDGLARRAGLIFIANALRTLIVALFMALFFDRLVTRHVRRVVHHLESPIGSTPSALALKRKRHTRDELDELVDAVNQMHNRLDSYHQEIANEKNRYYALVENNPEAIWRCELTTAISIAQGPVGIVTALQENAVLAELNQAAAELAGSADPCAMIGAHWSKLPFIQPALWQSLVDHHFRVKDVISHFVDDDGTKHFFSNSLTCLIADDQLQTVWGIAIDITQRITAQQKLELREQELSASQARLAEAQSLAHMGHWAYQTEGDCLQVSDEFARIYGFVPQRDTITWPALIERIHPQDRAYVIKALADVSAEAVGAEHRIIWPSGEERHVQAIARKRIEHGGVSSTFGILMDITDRRRAEESRRQSQQALIESEARMAEAQAIARMGHWIMDSQTRTLTCSDEFYRLHGHQPQSFTPDIRIFVNQIHPADRERIKNVLNNLGERAHSEDYRIIHPDGEVRYMRGTITPFYSGGKRIERVFGISMDITERKLAEMELHASQELFTIAFEASPDGIAFIDCESKRIIEVNHAFIEISGYDESALVGRPIAVLDNDDKKQSLSFVIECSDQAHNVEIRLQKEGGADITCLLSWRRIELRGRPFTLAMLRDVTALRALERTAIQQQKQLLRADKLASLGTMVAGVAHEINNPNHLIQMNADLLESFSGHLIELAEEAAQKYPHNLQFNGMPLEEILSTTPELLHDIKVSSRRIDRIVKDLKDFSRPRDNAEFLPTDLNHVIKKARNLLASTLDKRPQRVVFDLHPQLPLIMADSQRLEQVIVNLVTNALDASEEGGTITIKTYAEGSEVGCDVTDQGCGISSENLKHIFDPFFTTKQEIGGTGLGLAISFRLIREHKGQLEAISRPGQGTTMRITLPVMAATGNHSSKPLE